ncbi:hypothetical protein [Burkholderia ubonensis]|uniref:hypothetical protein n=1 Tax=Burkholderia ubonensis TaxID=101571 RepID=UPI00076BC720|nr:hypothetical protein [Burkholderia ubonensis]KVP77454.1 hypothetical protein WJ93_04835 [Burkholderia ubonensis]
MSTLADIAPLSELRARFGDNLTVREYGKADLTKIIKDKPLAMHAIGGNVWNRVVTKQWVQVDPLQLRGHFQRLDPKLHAAIAKVVGEEAIRDIRLVKAWSGAPRKANLVMELLVADVYRDELHLGDVTFCDPDRPIAPVDRVYELQTHKGLGLFGVLLANMESFARQKGYQQLTLTAGNADLVPLFQQHGFEVENNIAGRTGLLAGMSIPMERKV